MNQFSQLSKTKLSECHDDLILIANKAITDSPYDFKITEGHRSPQRQFELYKKGRTLFGEKWVITDKSKVVTNVDGITNMSKHNHKPSKAFDIQVIVNGKGTWIPKYYKPVASHIESIAEKLLLEGEVSKKIRWGGNFKTLVDMPHFEIKY